MYGGEPPKKLRVVCDISMGGTNPEELRKLGAPNNLSIRHLSKLHAKVYISSKGVVVSSANASENGIGFTGFESGHYEAGIFSKKGSSAYEASVKWFEAIWAKSLIVDEGTLKEAQDCWRNRRSRPEKASNKISLVEAIRTRPEAFGLIQFVFTNTVTPKETIRKAEEKAIEEIGISREELKGFSHFGGWGLPVEKWPYFFINVHQGPRGGLYLEFRERGFVVDEIHFARRISKLGEPFGDLKIMISDWTIGDDDFVEKIFARVDEEGGCIMCPEEIASFLAMD